MDAAVKRPRVDDDREAELLDAAVHVLAEVGYDRMTMDAVALRRRPRRQPCTGAGRARRSWWWTR
jgi:hypothetical protein